MALNQDYNHVATLNSVCLFNIFLARLIEIGCNIRSRQIENRDCLYFILFALSSLDGIRVLRQ